MTCFSKVRFFLIFCLSSFVLLSGCSRQMINFASENDRSQTPLVSSSNDFFLGGVFQSGIIDAAGVCGGRSKVAQVATVTSVQNILLTWITFGLYTPRSYEVYCRRR